LASTQNQPYSSQRGVADTERLQRNNNDNKIGDKKMKIEQKIVYNLTLDSDEKAEILKRMTAIKNATIGSFCNSVSCCGINCSECPFNNLTDIEDRIDELVETFLKEYRALQKDNPSLPSID
jgi:hypothetical protein